MDYCGEYLALIYDQYTHKQNDKELPFYLNEARKSGGRILEAACGTGLVLLPLMKECLDVYGFDVSEEMLRVLRAKAKTDQVTGIESR